MFVSFFTLLGSCVLGGRRICKRRWVRYPAWREEKVKPSLWSKGVDDGPEHEAFWKPCGRQELTE